MLFLQINLQMFNGEKTEKATPKRRKEARDKGQVLQSKEINSAFILLFTFLVLRSMGNYIYEHMTAFTQNILMEMSNVSNIYTVTGVHRLFISMVIATAKIVIPIVAAAFVTGIIFSYLQVGYLFTTKPLQPKLSKINPVNGFKRLFSLKPLVEFFKSVIKIGAVGYVAFSYLIDEAKNISKILDMEVIQIMGYLGQVTIGITLRAAIILIILAVLDYYYQRWEHEKEMKMSKQEIKEEYKQIEGDPQIKSKIKEKQRQISMGRMMQDVPKADVIITNPTHYAVAIRYDVSIGDAPIVLAKGKDLIAQNIKKLASENEIPIVENKELARTIYAMVDIGEYIPPDLYQAVAEVLAYVYKIKNIH
ncbi:flagellar biosynthesis protein FlhB [Clostridiaceae bacterium 35-E11]